MLVYPLRFQGRDLQVKVEIRNHSTRPVKPKFLLYEKKSYFAQGHRKVCTSKILKEKIEAIAPSSNKTVTQVITIPRELPPSILNCSIFKLEYRLTVNCIILWSSLRRSSDYMLDYLFRHILADAE